MISNFITYGTWLFSVVKTICIESVILTKWIILASSLNNFQSMLKLLKFNDVSSLLNQRIPLIMYFETSFHFNFRIDYQNMDNKFLSARQFLSFVINYLYNFVDHEFRNRMRAFASATIWKILSTEFDMGNVKL